jgi:hypothetical protein
MEVREVPPQPAGKNAPRTKAPRCRRCDKRIYVPKGWSPGAATRRHYWSKHADVMRASGLKDRR